MREPSRRPSRVIWLATFSVLAGAVTIGGYAYHRRQSDDFRAQVAQQLSSVAELRVAEIGHWRSDLISAAMVVSSAPELLRAMPRLLSGERTRPPLDDLRRWLESTSMNFQCDDILLLDPAGNVLLSATKTRGPAPDGNAHLAARAAKEGGVFFADLERSTKGKVHVDVVAPLVARGPGGARTLGAVVLRADPVIFLYPLLQSWPTPSPSAESYIVRREGDEVLYLSEVRHRIDTALSLRRPAADEPLAEGDALWEKRDYRETPVVAVTRKVPDSAWILIAKQDTDEALAPLHALGRTAALLVALLFLGTASAVALLWRHRWAVYYRRQYQAEVEREVLARRNAHLSRYANDIILLTDGELRILEANERAAASYGYGPQELVGMSVTELHVPGAAFSAAEQMQQALAQGGCVYETLQRRRDGSVFPVEVSAGGFTIQGGGDYCQYIIRDITERRRAEEALRRHTELLERKVEEQRQAEEALRESESLFRSLAEQSLVGVFLIQEEVFRYANPRLAEMLRYDPDDLVGRMSPLDVIHPADRPRVAGHIRRLLHDTLSIRDEFRLVRSDGTEFPAEVFGTRTLFRSRRAIVGSLIDASERRRLEREVLRVEKLESLAILAGGIAHDFNNLLASILGNLSMARLEAGSQGPLADTLADAEQAALRAKDLTFQLLTFSKGGDPIKKRVSLAKLAREAASFALRGSRVACEYVFTADLWPVEVDAGQMRQVVNNLVLNAVQAMPNGGVIRLSAENVDHDSGAPPGLPQGRSVRLSVEDHGVGIAPDVRHKIFDPYFTTKPGGTGLGLASAYSIVSRHRGHIDVESELGGGTTFTIHLPAAGELPAATPSDHLVLRAGRGRILLMDDDEPLRKTAGRMLERLGFEVAAARDGEEALALYARAKEAGAAFDAVILDLTVAGARGGRETVQRLQEIDPTVKAIVSSGYSNDPIMADFRQHGFAGVVTKPYRIQDLGEALQQVLGPLS